MDYTAGAGRAGLAFRRGLPASIAAFFTISWLAGAAGAQTLPDPTKVDDIRPGEKLQDRFDRRQPPVGMHVGALFLKPSVTVGTGYNDNVFNQQSGTQGDFFGVAGVNLDVDYAKDTFTASLKNAFLDREYLGERRESFWQGQSRLSLRDAITHDFAVVGEGGIQRLVVPRNDPNGLNGLEPSTFLFYDAYAGVQIGTPLRNMVSLSVGANQSKFDPVSNTLGPINVDERNRREVFGIARYDHSFYGQQKGFVEFRMNDRAYEQDPADNGFRRSSNGWRLDFGGTIDLKVVTVTASTGWQQQSYDDDRYDTIGQPDGTVTINWEPTRATTVTGTYIHEYAEDVGFESPGYVRDQFGIRIDHELRRNVLLTLYSTYDMRDLEKSTREFNIFTTLARAQYQFADGIVASFDYLYTDQDTNTARNYSGNVFTLNLKKKF